MDQSEIELAEDMGLGCTDIFFFKMEEITMYLYGGWNEQQRKKLTMQKVDKAWDMSLNQKEDKVHLGM